MGKGQAETKGAATELQRPPLRRGWALPLHRGWVLRSALLLCPPLLALLLLWAGLPLLYPDSLQDTAGAEPQQYTGTDFEAVVARRSSHQGQDLVIQAMRPALHNDGWVGEAVFRLPAPLPARSFSQFKLHLTGWQPSQSVYLLWRSSQIPEQQQALELEHDSDGISWHSLPTADRWGGEISELAIGVFGPSQSPALTLHGLELHGTTRPVVVQRMFWEWQRFKPWIQSSANRYPGFRGETLLPPGAAASLWAGLGLLLLLAGHLLARHAGVSCPRTTLVAGLICITLPWLALDTLWQKQLERQLQATRERFGGLSQTQKHTREDDARLQAWASQVKQQLAPLRGKRLFLLNDADRGHQYHRLRLQFHLLPLNVYNFGKQLLAPGQMRPGDYVLLLSPATAVSYDTGESRLEGDEYGYRATLLAEHSRGRLFRLEAPLAAMGGKH